MSTCKLLVVGLNGTSWELINNLIKHGHMPAVEKLIDGGSYGLLKSILPALDYPSAASFYTGLSPGQHRIFGFSEIGDNGLPTGKLVSWKSLKSKTLLEILSDNGKRVISLYMPLTYPPKAINGYIVSEMLSQNATEASHPPELIKELYSQFKDLMIPRPRQFFPADGFKNSSDIQNFLNKQIQSITRTKEIILYLIKNSSADVAFVQFYATDTVQHALWHYLDPGHPHFIQDAEIERMIFRFFSKLDRSIEELLQGINPKAILVFADHGFRPCVKILNLQKFLKGLKVRLLLFKKPIYVDFKTLYVNTKMLGEAYTHELIQRLEALVDKETDKRVINHIWRAEDIYKECDLVKNASIFILDLAEGYTSRQGSTKQPLLIPCLPNKNYLSGTHTREGFWILTGQGVNQRKNHHAEILDLAPTILSYLGINKPEWMNGNILL